MTGNSTLKGTPSLARSISGAFFWGFFTVHFGSISGGRNRKRHVSAPEMTPKRRLKPWHGPFRTHFGPRGSLPLWEIPPGMAETRRDTHQHPICSARRLFLICPPRGTNLPQTCQSHKLAKLAPTHAATGQSLGAGGTVVRVRALPSLGIRPSIKIPIDLYRDASSETGTWQPLIAARRRGGGR